MSYGHEDKEQAQMQIALAVGKYDSLDAQKHLDMARSFLL